MYKICVYVFISLGHVPRNGIYGSHGNMFNILKNCQIVYQTSCIIYEGSHQQCVRVPIVPHQHLLPIFLIIVILVWVKWYLVVLICISLMTNDVEYFFLCLWHLKTFVYTLWKKSIQILCLF